MARMCARLFVPLILAGAAMAQAPQTLQHVNARDGIRPTVFVRNAGQAPADISWQANRRGIRGVLRP